VIWLLNLYIVVSKFVPLPSYQASWVIGSGKVLDKPCIVSGNPHNSARGFSLYKYWVTVRLSRQVTGRQHTRLHPSPTPSSLPLLRPWAVWSTALRTSRVYTCGLLACSLLVVSLLLPPVTLHLHVDAQNVSYRHWNSLNSDGEDVGTRMKWIELILKHFIIDIQNTLIYCEIICIHKYFTLNCIVLYPWFYELLNIYMV
jgi:hypothetical protein